MFRKLFDSILSFTFSHGSASMDLSAISSETKCDGSQAASRISPSSRTNLLQYLLALTRENAAYYHAETATSSGMQDRYAPVLEVLTTLCGHIPDIERLTDKLTQNAHLFDCPGTQGNGYRSLVACVDACVVKLLESSIYMKENRDRFYFRLASCTTDIKNYTDIFGMFRAILQYADRMMGLESETENRELFPPNGSDLIEEWLVNVETLNQKCFFGSCTAFQFCPSIRAALQTITTALAAFAEKYQALEAEKPGTGPQALSYLGSNFLATGKFMLDPDLKASILVMSTRDMDVRFCKAFWSVSESKFFEPVHWWMLPKCDLNRELTIVPESFTLSKIGSNELVTIEAPTACFGQRLLQARLMSCKLREGQLFIDANDTVKSFKLPDRILPKSDYLIFHCHGGGFVAQSSKSCDLYLSEWTQELQAPIFSIDYTLAPEGPYPRAVEETFYAYCWALKYAHKLGWNEKKIVLAGDSAGGNLIFGVAFRAFMEGIRMPDGILAIYAPLLVQYTPSPSRLMALMDPLIPIGIQTRCLASYAGLPEPTDVGGVQGSGMDNSPTDSSPSNELHNSWEELSPSELQGVEDMKSISPSVSEDNMRAEEKLKEQHARARISAAQRTFRIPTAQHIFSVATPVTSRLKHTVRRATNLLGRGYTGIMNFVDGESTPVRPRTLRRAQSIVNPSAPWTKMMNPLKRYNFATVPTDDALLSPLQANEILLRALPPVTLISCHLCPFLDDSVEMARKLSKLDMPVKLDLVSHLPHGFLNFLLVSEEARDANRLAMERLKTLFQFETVNTSMI